jgi:D-serine deaminase-like pyridoxal phosphate-dependent protein
LNANIVSGGSTPTAYQSHFMPRMTEIRPGTYIYNDMNTVAGGFCSIDDCAASVVSNAVPGKVVVDGGAKTLAADRNIPNPDSGYGYVVQYPKAKVVRLSEEHGEIDISTCDSAPKLGERISIIPNHICPCVNLHDSFWLQTTNHELPEMNIDTRGKLS